MKILEIILFMFLIGKTWIDNDKDKKVMGFVDLTATVVPVGYQQELAEQEVINSDYVSQSGLAEMPLEGDNSVNFEILITSQACPSNPPSCIQGLRQSGVVMSWTDTTNDNIYNPRWVAQWLTIGEQSK